MTVIAAITFWWAAIIVVIAVAGGRAAAAIAIHEAAPAWRAVTVSARAIAVGALNYKSIASIIAHNLDRPAPVEASVVAHANVRGRGYFH